MSNRYLVPEAQPQTTIKLIDNQAHHAINVMRLKVGAEVTIFDGAGAEFSGVVESLSRKEVDVAIGDVRLICREPSCQITVACAIPKGDRQRWLVEKLTELGVYKFVPVLCERSSVKLSKSLLGKFERYVVEASKQCLRNQLMNCDQPVKFGDFVTHEFQNQTRLIASTVEPRISISKAVTESNAQQFIALIGPEGGFSNAEMEHAQEHGWQSVTLGKSVLRIETAAVAVSAIIVASAAIQD